MKNIKDIEAALKYAIKIIESYQMDINNSESFSKDLNLKNIGFCQGSIYTNALNTIDRIKKGEIRP